MQVGVGFARALTHQAASRSSNAGSNSDVSGNHSRGGICSRSSLNVGVHSSLSEPLRAALAGPRLDVQVPSRKTREMQEERLAECTRYVSGSCARGMAPEKMECVCTVSGVWGW